jgi:hypothetical protein
VIFDFEQVKGGKLPESWGRFCSLIRVLPGEPLPKNELLDIFYNGLTIESKTHLKGICPRGNNKVVINIFHVYDKCLFLMLEL